MDIIKDYKLSKNIILVESKNLDTFLNKYRENEIYMITHPEYKSKIPPHRVYNPEHWCAEYNLINHSKINYVNHAKKIYSDYEYYSWIDFGCIRNIRDIPKQINFNLLDKKIHYLNLTEIPENKIDENEMLKTDIIYIAGSQFVVHRDLVEIFENLYSKKLEEWKRRLICDDDQNMVYQIYIENIELFHLHRGGVWYSLFSKHLNTIN